MLELEDFNNIFSLREKAEKEETKEQLEKRYIEEIQKLKKEYEENIKIQTEKAYEKGLQEGYTQAETKLKKEYQNQLQSILKEKEKKIDNTLSQLKEIEKQINEKYKKYIDNIREILIDSLSEILQLLYIDTKNHNQITKAIETILLEFKEQEKIQIYVSEALYQTLKDTFNNLQKNPQLENYDFIIDFGEFQIENKLKEKLKIIKDEIKREIKKLT
ncbi:MAG: hypothetical protein GXO22_04750 [Aquificae bacterium]|nr:hypothetical protein [Aquificota bacterium]